MFYIGQLCIPNAKAWIEMQRSSRQMLDKDPSPQPVIKLSAHYPCAMLAFPYWWWEEKDLIPVEGLVPDLSE